MDDSGTCLFLLGSAPQGLAALSAVVGPLHLATVDGWHVLARALPADGSPDVDEIELGLVLSRVRRRGRRGDLVLVLFTEAVGEVTGLALCVGGDLLTAHVWGSGPAQDGGGEERPIGDAEVIARCLGVEEDQGLIRALLRRSPDRAAAVGELTVLLGLPPVIVDLLLGRRTVGELPGNRLLDEPSIWRAAWSDAGDGPSWFWTSPALVVAAWAGLAVVLALGVVALVEAAAGEPDTGPWLLVALLAVATNGGYLLARRRRGD